MSQCIWQPRTSAYILCYFTLFLPFSFKKTTEWIQNGFRTTTQICTVIECWCHVCYCLASWSMPQPKGFKSLWEKVSVSSRLMLCKAAATANLVFMCITVRSIIHTHTFLNDKIVGDAFLCYGFFIVFSLKKKTAVEWQKKKKQKNKVASCRNKLWFSRFPAPLEHTAASITFRSPWASEGPALGLQLVEIP